MIGTLAVSQTSAQTIWNGPTTNFNQAQFTTDVLVPGKVSLTRADRQWLYNPAGGDSGPFTGTPSDTEWAFGNLSNPTSLQYQTFDSYRGIQPTLADEILNKPMVCHLIKENIYLAVTFTEWTVSGGPFAYTRSTPAAVVSSPPTVSITSPTNGATFTAPATVPITATASSSSGTIASVKFFANGNIIGTATTSPYTASASALPAGSYTLSAIATDNSGASATNSIQITVGAAVPVNITLSAPSLSGGQLQFTASGLTVGKSNFVQASSDLASRNWVSIATNLAAATNASVSVSAPVNSPYSFFRIVQAP